MPLRLPYHDRYPHSPITELNTDVAGTPLSSFALLSMTEMRGKMTEDRQCHSACLITTVIPIRRSRS